MINNKISSTMKNFYRYLAALTIITALSSTFSGVLAGNKDRSGLLIRGLEAQVGEV
jgi:hypothetical protein